MKSSLLSDEEVPVSDLSSIQLEDATETSGLTGNKFINAEENTFFQSFPTEFVKTRRGDILVAIQGDQNKKRTAILTLHDIGQNHMTGFQSFFCFHQFRPLVENFTVYHLNFPGQQENAEELPQDYEYPTMDEMALCLEDVFEHFKLTNTICFGVGAGANVFVRFAFLNPKHIECLLLVNPTVNKSSWSEWGYEKMSSHYLKTKGMTQFCEDFLLNHFFGNLDEHTNRDLVSMVREQLHNIKQPRNLALFIDSFSKRSVVKISRPLPSDASSTTSLKCGVLILTGDRSPAVDDTVDVNSKLNPANSTWMKISDASSLVLDEQPTSVTNAIVLFLQGYGHIMKAKAPRLNFPQYQDEEIQGPPALC